MKTSRFLILIELLTGIALSLCAVFTKDTDMLIVGCMLIICGKIDLLNNTTDK